MTHIPESLRRVLDARKTPAGPIASKRPGVETVIWRDGEVYRIFPNGRFLQRPSVPPVK